jgi:hypothetical protein
VEAPEVVVGVGPVAGLVKVGKVEIPKVVVGMTEVVVEMITEIPKVVAGMTEVLVEMITVGKASLVRVLMEIEVSLVEVLLVQISLIQADPSVQQKPPHKKTPGPGLQGTLQKAWPFEESHWEASWQHPAVPGH